MPMISIFQIFIKYKLARTMSSDLNVYAESDSTSSDEEDSWHRNEIFDIRNYKLFRKEKDDFHYSMSRVSEMNNQIIQFIQHIEIMIQNNDCLRVAKKSIEENIEIALERIKNPGKNQHGEYEYNEFCLQFFFALHRIIQQDKNVAIGLFEMMKNKILPLLMEIRFKLNLYTFFRLTDYVDENINRVVD